MLPTQRSLSIPTNDHINCTILMASFLAVGSGYIGGWVGDGAEEEVFENFLNSKFTWVLVIWESMPIDFSFVAFFPPGKFMLHSFPLSCQLMIYKWDYFPPWALILLPNGLCWISMSQTVCLMCRGQGNEANDHKPSTQFWVTSSNPAHTGWTPKLLPTTSCAWTSW